MPGNRSAALPAFLSPSGTTDLRLHGTPELPIRRPDGARHGERGFLELKPQALRLSPFRVKSSLKESLRSP